MAPVAGQPIKEACKEVELAEAEEGAVKKDAISPRRGSTSESHEDEAQATPPSSAPSGEAATTATAATAAVATCGTDGMNSGADAAESGLDTADNVNAVPPTPSARSCRKESRAHLRRVLKTVLKTSPMVPIYTVAAVSLAKVIPPTMAVSIFYMVNFEILSATFEFSWFRMNSAIHWPISTVTMALTCIAFAIFPVRVDSVVVKLSTLFAIVSVGLFLRETVYEALVHNANKPVSSRIGESVIGGLAYTIGMYANMAFCVMAVTAAQWWPNTAVANSWESYLWACVIAPITVKILTWGTAAVERTMAAGAGGQAADLISCQFIAATTIGLGTIGGWIIYSSPTPNQAALAMLADLALDASIKLATDKNFRVFFTHAVCRSGARVHAEGVAEATNEQDSEITGHPESPPTDAYDPMQGENRLDPVERTIQGIAVGAGFQLVPSMVVASVALIASLITEQKFSPLNLLVLMLEDVTYLLEGYVLLVGAQRAYGRVITFSSLERKWDLYLDHDVSSYVTYGNLIAGAVAHPFAALVIARAK